MSRFLRRACLSLAACALADARLGGQAAPSPAPADAPAFSAERFAAHARTLASDAFGGRGPETDGEARTVAYLREQLTAMGLAPEIQTVKVVGNTTDRAKSTLAVTSPRGLLTFALGERALLGTVTGREDVAIADGALVFVGYGIHAPELGWDDYAGVDVRGKTVVVLIGEPPAFAAGEATFMSRSGYKFDAAARQGATAALVVHDPKGAGFPWEEIAGQWRGQQFALAPEDDPAPRVDLRGWLRQDAAEALFAAAGTSLGSVRRAAGRRGFRAVPLAGVALQAHVANRAFTAASKNVIAKLEGTRRPEEAVVYSAHWDHLGTHPGERSADTIYNGAIDNATGVACVLEIAARFAREPRPERTVLFLFPTLEEEGLLGSRYYVAHPLTPLAKIVADLNVDTIVPFGPARDFAVVGLGRSELDDVLRPLAKRQRRTLSGEAKTQADHFFRSDHLSFARAGVPVLFLRGGVHSANVGLGGEDLGVQAWNAFNFRYHRPSDEWNPDWDLRGVVADLEVMYGVGRELAAGRAWPNYRAGTLLRVLRDATEAERRP